MRTNWDANVFCNKSFSCCTLSSSDVKFSLPPKEAKKKKKKPKTTKMIVNFFLFYFWFECLVDHILVLLFPIIMPATWEFCHIISKNAVTSVIKFPRKRIGCSEISTIFGSILNSNLFWLMCNFWGNLQGITISSFSFFEFQTVEFEHIWSSNFARVFWVLARLYKFFRFFQTRVLLSLSFEGWNSSSIWVSIARSGLRVYY